MKTVYYHLSHSLNDQELKELPILFNNKARNKNYYQARKSCCTLIEKTSKLKVFLKDISIENFHQVKNYPQFKVSLSHTKECGAAVMGYTEEVNSVGIDLESIDRKINEEGHKYFSNELDNHKLNLLETWCAKEACFKALSNKGLAISLLKEVVLEQDCFYFIHDKNKISYPFKLIQDDKYLVAIAICSKDNQQINIEKIN